MPLVACPDCGRQVSTAARTCPQCGRPAPFSAATRPLVDDRFPADEQPVSIAPRNSARTDASPPSPQLRRALARKEAEEQRERSIVAPAVGALVLALAIGWCSTRPANPPGPTVAQVEAPQRILPETQIRLAEEAVRASLKDGESARFSEVRIGRILDATTGVGAVCGRVNAKNSFGGYGGAQRFIAANKVAFLEEMMPRSEFATSWSEFCQTK